MTIEIDWVFVLMVLLPCCALWALVGFELCRVTHKQRGIDVDRPVTDNIPDFVPDDWTVGASQGT